MASGPVTIIVLVLGFFILVLVLFGNIPSSHQPPKHRSNLGLPKGTWPHGS